MVRIENNPKFNSSDLKPHIGIWLLLRNDQDQILMVYHKKFNEWTIPLEKLDPGEKLEDAILRTGREEIGIDVIEHETLLRKDFEYLRNGVSLTNECILVEVTQYSGVPENMEPDKHTEIAWKEPSFILGQETKLDSNETMKQYLRGLRETNLSKRV